MSTTIKPLAMSRKDTAESLGLSLSLVQQLTREGDFPNTVQLSPGRVGYRTVDVEEWLAARPPSSCLPPKDSGYGRAGKPGKDITL